jgi:hypothetical protein
VPFSTVSRISSALLSPPMKRTEYVLDHEGWDEVARRAASRDVIGLVAGTATAAATDIPWDRRDEWPTEVVESAARLRDRFVPEGERARPYMQTGLHPLEDEQARQDFVTFVLYAYDAALFVGEDELINSADEGTSLVVSLNDGERHALERIVGAGRVVTLQEWRDRHPSPLRRLVKRLAGS